VTGARDLTGELGLVRDQGPRGTCLAFAATAVHEQARRQRRGVWTDLLGEEILYWSCKQLDADGKAGTYPRSVGDVLRDSGQSAAKLWPYDPRRDEAAADYAPPAAAREPDQMRRATVRTISHRLDELRARVDAGHAVILGLELWPAFFSAPNGALTTPAPLELIGEAHAVALVGYDDGPEELLLRNSWGTRWGQAGHGRLPYAALPIVARGAWTLDDDLNG
jgi:hypothetical protein